MDLGKQANAAGSPKLAESKETTTLLVKKRRSPLWLMIFPEGTITSDEERAKSLRYAEREGVVSRLGAGAALAWALEVS